MSLKLPLRVLWLPALLSIPLFLGGCAQGEGTLASLRENPILQNAARAVLMGKIYDRAAIANRNGDNQALVAAADELAKIDPVASAEQLVLAGAQLDGRSQLSKDARQKKIFEAQANLKYREALRVSPNFPSDNPELLNALGYFLADRGQNKSDFQTAEKLTRAALKSQNESIAQMENAPITSPLLPNLKFSRSNTRDSLAWALFRLGQFAKAKTEQTQVLQEAEAIAPRVGQKISADLYFHMGEIERASKNLAAAEKNYQAALKAEPDHEDTLNAFGKIGKKPPAAPRKSAPQTPAPSDGIPSEDFPKGDEQPDNSPPNNDLSSGTLEAWSTPRGTKHYEI